MRPLVALFLGMAFSSQALGASEPHQTTCTCEGERSDKIPEDKCQEGSAPLTVLMNPTNPNPMKFAQASCESELSGSCSRVHCLISATEPQPAGSAPADPAPDEAAPSSGAPASAGQPAPGNTDNPVSVNGKVVQAKNGVSWVLNRDAISDADKITGEPGREVEEEGPAAREAYAAEYVAGMEEVTSVSLGAAAYTEIYGKGAAKGLKNVDVVGKLSDGSYVLAEGKGKDPESAVESQFKKVAQTLGKDKIVHYIVVVPESLATGYGSDAEGALTKFGERYLVLGTELVWVVYTHFEKPKE